MRKSSWESFDSHVILETNIQTGNSYNNFHSRGKVVTTSLNYNDFMRNINYSSCMLHEYLLVVEMALTLCPLRFYPYELIKEGHHAQGKISYIIDISQSLCHNFYEKTRSVIL